MMQRLLAAIKKEFLQFKRDRMLIILILWTYTIEVVMCTMALSFEVINPAIKYLNLMQHKQSLGV